MIFLNKAKHLLQMQIPIKEGVQGFALMRFCVIFGTFLREFLF